MKDYVINGQKSPLFSEPEYDSLLLGHLGLLGGQWPLMEVASWFSSLKVGQSPGFPECPPDRFLLLFSFYRNILFKEPRSRFRLVPGAAAISSRKRAISSLTDHVQMDQEETECFFMRFCV